MMGDARVGVGVGGAGESLEVVPTKSPTEGIFREGTSMLKSLSIPIIWKV